MSVQEQLLTLYLLNLKQICDDYVSSNDKPNPTLYNNLYQLHKYYDSIGLVPELHREYFQPIFIILLNSEYDDYCSDEGPISFDEYLNFWKNLDFENSYTGNGGHNINILILNTLKKIYILMR